MKTSFHFARLAFLHLAGLLLIVPYQCMFAATLHDFGFANMNVNGQLALGHRPLLVILANFAGRPLPTPSSLPHDAAYYDDFAFNLFRTPSVSGYFLTMSNGRFYWSRGGHNRTS